MPVGSATKHVAQQRAVPTPTPQPLETLAALEVHLQPLLPNTILWDIKHLKHADIAIPVD